MMRAVIAALVLTAGSAGVANDAKEVARSEGFSCGGEFVTMGHTEGGSFAPSIILTTRRARVIEVWTWIDGASTVRIEGLGEEPMRLLNISPATSAMLRKCLEGG